MKFFIFTFLGRITYLIVRLLSVIAAFCIAFRVSYFILKKLGINFREDGQNGDIITASATIVLTLATIYLSHRDAINSQVIAFREFAITKMCFYLDFFQCVLKAEGCFTFHEDSVIMELEYENLFSSYFSVKPYCCILNQRKSNGKNINTSLVWVRNYHLVKEYDIKGNSGKEASIKYRLLLELEKTSVLMDYLTAASDVPGTETSISIDFLYNNLYTRKFYIDLFCGKYYIRERAMVSHPISDKRGLSNDYTAVRVDFVEHSRAPILDIIAIIRHIR